MSHRPLRPATTHAIEVPRTARYFTIGEDGAAKRELWIVLHGFSQLAGDFVQFFGDLADGSRLVVAPEALNRYYVVQSTAMPASERPVGATWMTREDRVNEIKDYVRYLDLLHARLIERHPSAATNVIGFSQGGATAARWALQGSAKIDRLILWGATLPPDVDLSTAVRQLRGAKLTLVAGSRDQYITPAALSAERARLTAAGLNFDTLEYEGGHSIKRSALQQLVVGARLAEG